jgi:raffinose/stachyose/melibiose transport system permease protein
MIPNVISVAAWAMIFRFLFDDRMGFINDIVRVFNPGFEVNWLTTSPYAFWLVTFTWLFFSVVVTLLVQGDLSAIGYELHDAAHIDGANVMQQTFMIDLPLCRNAIGTSVIISIASRIAMFESIMLLTRGGPGNDTMNIPNLMFRRILDYESGYANSMATVMILFGLITLFIVNKVFRMNKSVY